MRKDRMHAIFGRSLRNSFIVVGIVLSLGVLPVWAQDVQAADGRTTTVTDRVTLSSSTSIDGDLIVQAGLNLNGCELYVPGDVLMEADIDLAGGTLHIGGSLHQVDSVLYVNQGTLLVEGDYCIEGTEPDENGEMRTSYGWIKMENDADTITVLGDFWARSYNSSVLSAGVMQFNGDVTDYRGATIRGSGTHLAQFGSVPSAKNPMVVDLADGACFQSIATDGAVQFRQMGISTLTRDIELYGDVEEIRNKLDLNGYTLTIHGNVNYEKAELNLNGGRLVVTGDFRHLDPVIYFNKGTLQVDGDYLLESDELEDDSETPKTVYGWLKMEDPLDQLIVGGDFYARSYNSSVMTAGSISFGGNVTDYRGATIRGGSTHIARFTGTQNEQIVDLQDSGACFQSISTGGARVIFRQLGIHTLTEDITLSGDVENIWNALDLNGYTLTILGDVKKVSAEINLNGGSLIVTGSFRHVDPVITFNKGTLQVNGDYILESDETEEDGTPRTVYGWLKMENDEDRLVVGGDFNARSYNSSVMTAGTLEFKGNVTDHRGATIRGSGTNLAIFSGEGPQVVEFEDRGACFQSIRTINEDVQFKTLGVKELTENAVIAGPVEKIWNNLDLNGYDLTIKGDVEGLMSDLTLNRGTMHVMGDFRHLDPVIVFAGGALIIDGDYYLESAETEADGTPKTVYGWLKMENPDDHMIVDRDFTARSYNSSVMNAGILQIGGNMSDEKGNTLKMTGLGSEGTTVVSGSSLSPKAIG